MLETSTKTKQQQKVVIVFGLKWTIKAHIVIALVLRDKLGTNKNRK